MRLAPEKCWAGGQFFLDLIRHPTIFGSPPGFFFDRSMRQVHTSSATLFTSNRTADEFPLKGNTRSGFDFLFFTFKSWAETSL
jgi:hypothetical protein